jgi:hypothetical protein
VDPLPLPEAPSGTVTRPVTIRPPGALRALLGMSSCYWSATLLAGAVAFLVIGVPTALVDTPVFGRQIAPHWWDYAILGASSLLIGMVWAARTPAGPEARTGATADPDEESSRRRSVLAGAVTYLAVGCPVCNKVVLLALGTSGALSWFAPVQPLLGLTAVALLAVTLRRRLRGVGPLACGT